MADFREALLGRGVRTLRILWLAMLLFPPVMGALLFLLVPAEGKRAAPEALAVFVLVLRAVAVAEALLAVAWRPIFLSPARLGALAPSDMPAEDAARRFGAAPQSPADRKALAVFAQFQTQHIIAWAFADAVAIYGFVLFLMTGDRAHLLVMSGGALLLTALLLAPSRGALERALDVGGG